ncbi:hypothetical protein TOPH_07056 [Tolypocladium ophioglossoides CBS 100239]|uniref:Uncharacterized protein n=1 Tax=Tolypocladium ophioglossoides (strain CBS 100239) TaxID=1163406 RepID=A0A0L0N2F4_TOLOC|nr:hypothetical protein TOPH_07056 [Tolypocladium ophioglossoides CBS 100239]
MNKKRLTRQRIGVSDTSIKSLASIAGSLEAFCSWLLERDILPDLALPAPQTAISGNKLGAPVALSPTLHKIAGLCNVSAYDLNPESPITSNGSSENAGLHKLVCSRAEIVDGPVAKESPNLKFRCHCENGEHGDLLSFQLPSARGLPIAEHLASGVRFHQILVNAHQRFVSVLIDHHRRRYQDYAVMRTLWSRLARLLLLEQDRNPGVPSSDRVFWLFDNSISILSSRA